MNFRVLPVAALLSLSAIAPLQAKTPIAQKPITEAQVLSAQKAWCNALLKISRDYADGGLPKAKATAAAILDGAYDYQSRPVAFKPTLTVAPQTFRTTRDGALAYFVGDDKAFPSDKGFALNPWVKCEIKNAVVQLHGNVAITMGNVMLTSKDGKVTTVDKTWAFRQAENGQLRIVLHHSSLPFKG